MPSSAPQVDLLSLARLRDPLGFLSVYVDADPHAKNAQRRPWAIAVENGLREVRERMREQGPRERWTALERRLGELQPALADLVDPASHGRGRALFAAVGSDEVRQIALQVPLVTRVVLDETAFIAPLAAALDEGRPAGFVAVSLPTVRVLDHRLGVTSELLTLSVDPDTSEWREMKGPAAANPARGQQSAPQRDRFERRLEEHRVRLLESAGTRLGQLVAEHGWDRLVVAGDPHLGKIVTEHVQMANGDVVLVGRTLEDLAPTELAAELAPELEAATRRRERELVERARDSALAGGHGAVGVADVLTALAEGRVSHLLYDPERELAGVRSPDGLLAPEGVVPPGVDAESLEPEPNLAERMVEAALATDAAVTPLEGEAAEALAETDGVAALLRW
ncbi:MAG TPA: VLRF1 family aeRF1-type release factor [Gaiellaceae bacterium]|nr:VLRF1 family aeRF1-type release factor [Gaiellaceae bacterium]